MSNRTVLTLAVSLALAACSSTPERNASLDRARIQYQAAQSDPQVLSLAPSELQRARASLERAERAFKDRDQRHNVDHLAYMASQQATIAQVTASSQAAEKITQNAAAERDRLLLQQRTLQADNAQMQLRLSEQDRMQLSRNLDRADYNARMDQQRVQSSDARAQTSEQEKQQLARELEQANQAARIAQQRVQSSDARAETSEQDKQQLARELEQANQNARIAQQRVQSSDARAQTSEQDKQQLARELEQAANQARIDQKRVQRSDARADALEMQLIALDAKKTDRGMVVTLGDVLFNTGQAQLLPDRSGGMDRLADFFKQYPHRTAAIEGYTDSVGSDASNYDLSQRRANAVKSALTDRGVPSDRLSTRAFGPENPAASNQTSAGRQLNRRVEIVFAPERENVSTQ